MRISLSIQDPWLSGIKFLTINARPPVSIEAGRAENQPAKSKADITKTAAERRAVKLLKLLKLLKPAIEALKAQKSHKQKCFRTLARLNLGRATWGSSKKQKPVESWPSVFILLQLLGPKHY